MKKFTLFWILFNIIFLGFQEMLVCQNLNKWVLIDTADRNQNLSIYLTDTKKMSALNENDIILCSATKSSDRIIERIKNKGAQTEEIFRENRIFSNENWNSLTHPSADVIVVVGDSVYEYNLNTKWIRVKHRMTLISRDGGISWSKTIGDSNTYFRDISMCDSLFGAVLHSYIGNLANYSVPQEDSLWITEDCWRTIKKIKFPDDSSTFKKVSCFSRSKFAILSGKSNVSFIYFTNDGGKSWQRSENIGNNTDIRNLVFAGNYVYATGIGNLVPNLTYSVLYRSTDGGMKWQELKSLYDSNFYSSDYNNCMDFADEMNGIISTGTGRINITGDGGNTWTTEYDPDINGVHNRINEVYYPNTGFALAVGGNAIIKRDTNLCLAIPKFNHIINKYSQPVNNVTVSWNNVKGATMYRLKITKISGIPFNPESFLNPGLDTTISGNSISISGLDSSTYYFGWIMAIGIKMMSSWSDNENLFNTVKTGDSLFSPEILYPEHNSMNMPANLTVHWSKVPCAVDYTLHVKFYNNQQWNLYENVVDTMLTISGLPANQAYKLYCIANAKDSNSNYFGSKSYKENMFVTGNVTSIDDKTKDSYSNLFFYPNPAGEISMAEIIADEPTDAEIIVINILGREVRRFRYRLNGGSNQIPINLSDFSSGVYFLKVITNNRILTGKIIKN